jgi:phenylacetic acid degradation operon negative regulatory protein
MSRGVSGAKEPPQLPKLTARSTILSALLGVHPPEAPVSQIISVANIVNLQESAVRVALTRMVAAGDLDRQDGTYRLSERLLARQSRQDAALRPTQLPWDGQWLIAVVTTTGEPATERGALREAFRQHRFRDLRDGVWTRPRNLDTVLPDTVTRRSQVFSAVPHAEPLALANSLFAPHEWADKGEYLLALFDTTDSLAAQFEVAAAIVHHILDDPLLPEELLSATWPGEALRTAYSQFRRDFAAACGAVLTT